MTAFFFSTDEGDAMETTSSASATPTAVPVATAEGNYHAMQSPAAKASPASGTTATHTAIQIEVVESSSKLEGSGYDKVMYDHDLVMIFPYREDGEKKEPENFTVEAFVALLTGKDQERSKRKNKIIVDPFLRIFRTTRCYLDDHGKEVLNVNEKDHSDKAEQERWEKEEELLSVEYENFVGSRNPTTEAQFCELVAMAVARRVQLACGLTTRMFRSCDNDEIIMTIKADDMDLRVEADRTDYPLQVCNKPFDQRLHHDKLEALRQEIGDEEFQKSKDHLQATRGAPSDDPDTAEMDPLLISEGEMYQPELRKALHCWGHTEEADGLFVEDESCRPSKVTSRLGQFFRSLTEVSYDPRTYFSPFADYRSEPMYQPYYRRYPVKWGEKKEETLFTQKDRIRLAASIVNRHINTDALVVAEYLVGNMFALHDKVALDDLRHSWALHWLMLNQPLHKIRYYFGEKVALYFAWLGFYTKMLVFPSIAGLITFIVVEARKENAKVGRSKSSDQGYILIVFAIIVVIWSSVFAEVWKRKNHIFNAIWGLHGFHRTLRYRAQFRGTKSYNPVTDAEEMTFENRIKRRRAFMTSVLVVLIMIGIVLVALFGLFWLKFFINEEVTENGVSHAKNVSDEYRSTYTLLITGANAIQILVLNTVYRGVAKKLTEYENHRTDREYENHLIIKVFLFQFCNSFASFFYIAFLKRYVEDKCIDSSFKDDDCMTELRDQLLILFLIRIIVGNTMEVVVPYLKYRVQLYLESRTLKDKQRHNYIEEQAKLVPYEQEEAFEDYNEMVIQFGFINLFVVAFPLTPLLALANNMAEVHVDAVKLCFVHRRPFPHAAKSIGAWFYILRFMSYIALGTNCALILWTSDIFTKDEMNNTTKAFVFVLAVQICIMISVAIERTVSDMPKQLGLLMERNEHVVDMVFKNMSLGDDSGLAETAESLDLTIYPNEQWDDRALPAVRA